VFFFFVTVLFFPEVDQYPFILIFDVLMKQFFDRWQWFIIPSTGVSVEHGIVDLFVVWCCIWCANDWIGVKRSLFNCTPEIWLTRLVSALMISEVLWEFSFRNSGLVKGFSFVALSLTYYRVPYQRRPISVKLNISLKAILNLSK
jgi:hypothetical protein